METLAQGEAYYTAVSLNVSNSRAYTHTTDENSKRKMALWNLGTDERIILKGTLTFWRRNYFFKF